MTRRTALAAAVAAPMLLPASPQGANDRVTMALIGAGGRGRRVAGEFVELGAKCAAVADVYEPNLALGLKVAGSGAQGYQDYRKILDRQDIDAVLIATPDHWHVPMMLAAVDAGKDVYCEKPMSHSISEGNRAIRGVRATDRIVQIGMQRRSTPWIIEAKKMVDDGAIGEITFAKAQWNWMVSAPLDNSPLPGKLDWQRFVGPAPQRAMQPQIFRKWRYFWEFSGGNMTDQGTHLMDVIQWFSNAGTPRSAACVGRVVGMQGSEVPDTFAATFEYPNLIATWTLNYNNDYENGWTIRFEGSNGTLVLDGGGYRLYDAPWRRNPDPVKVVEDKLPTTPHVRNFLECIKTREEPNAPVEIGHTAVCGPHLANIAMHTKKMAFLNPEATEIY
ncbi:MAG: hypothetical protein GC160_09160 [Acidobacteria bacterium]|nr:hypothetical protein [Acidobacteriota bacterium]